MQYSFGERKKTMKSKYSAQITTVDGIKFSSKLEAAFYRKLKIMKEHGDIKYFLRQVPFHLPGGVKYVVDFMIITENNQIRYIDVKGFDTPMSKAKRKIVEDLYPINIEIVKK